MNKVEDKAFFGLLGILAFFAFLGFFAFMIWQMRQISGVITTEDIEKARAIARRLE